MNFFQIENDFEKDGIKLLNIIRNQLKKDYIDAQFNLVITMTKELELELQRKGI